MSIMRKVTKRISPYMKTKGFNLSGNNYYYISNDIAYCLALDAPGGLLYATAYVMPLYVPSENRYYTYGSRLNYIHEILLPLLQKDDNTDVIDMWCDTLCKSLEEIIIPFYRQIETPNKLAEYVDHQAGGSSFIFACPPIFIDRLKMYTYLYLGDRSKTSISMNSFHEQIANCTFLTNGICQKYFREIDMVQSILQGSKQDISNFCCEILENTKKVLS